MKEPGWLDVPALLLKQNEQLMSHLPTLIADLALILLSAGVMTLIFKKLKQPLVLGYIVAGFIASPHLSFTPSVVDNASIQTWADIGVIFLLFALGLEFSFKKLVKVGGAAVVAACTIIVCMMLLGMGVGKAFGWGHMDCLFLGGMIAMSSTTIIYKAFEDLGLSKKSFAGLVLSILILEDILAIVLMVVLSTLAVSSNFEGSELAISIAKLVFFLILWFVVGIYVVPLFLRKCRKLMTDETLLIVALSLCFGMVVMASLVGFSPAFGAFIMGSILAETIEAESIERLVKPVKDLFGAIFFVSVGMMVDPVMIGTYAWPIVAITFAVLLGQAFFGTLGVVLAGKPLKIAMQCGFSLTQIGEFAFIIASLGVSLGVTSSFLYPIVVAVSVITTFLTPYVIRLAEPASRYVDAHLPEKWRQLLSRYSSGTQTVNQESMWHKLLMALLRIVVVYSTLSIAFVFLSLKWVSPFLCSHIPSPWGALLAAGITILCISPFLRAIMIKKNHSVEFVALWNDRLFNRAPLVATILVRIIIAVAFVVVIISQLFESSLALIIGVAIVVILAMIYSRSLKKQSILIERRFFQNLRSREMRDEYTGNKKPSYAGSLLSHDMHLAEYDLPADTLWAGKSLMQLNLGRKYGIHVTSILRGKRRINIPGGNVVLYPYDKIQVIGTDDQLNLFGEMVSQGVHQTDAPDYENHEMILKQLVISADSAFVGKSLRESAIRERFQCFVAGVERGTDGLATLKADVPIEEGDVMWVVGEKDNVYQLLAQKSEIIEEEEE
jgi:CPA2 family monovalent cation:H+ antiporter-2